MTANLGIDAVGIGIRSPLAFRNGSLRLTAENTALAPSDDGIGDAGVGTIRQIVASTDDQNRVIVQSLQRIIATPTGARFMFGGFGSRVPDVVFEINDESSHAILLTFGLLAIEAQESRIRVIDSSMAQDADNEIQMNAILTYSILRTKTAPQTAVILERSLEQ